MLKVGAPIGPCLQQLEISARLYRGQELELQKRFLSSGPSSCMEHLSIVEISMKREINESRTNPGQ